MQAIFASFVRSRPVGNCLRSWVVRYCRSFIQAPFFSTIMYPYFVYTLMYIWYSTIYLCNNIVWIVVKKYTLLKQFDNCGRVWKYITHLFGFFLPISNSFCPSIILFVSVVFHTLLILCFLPLKSFYISNKINLHQSDKRVWVPGCAPVILRIFNDVENWNHLWRRPTLILCIVQSAFPDTFAKRRNDNQHAVLQIRFNTHSHRWENLDELLSKKKKSNAPPKCVHTDLQKLSFCYFVWAEAEPYASALLALARCLLLCRCVRVIGKCLTNVQFIERGTWTERTVFVRVGECGFLAIVNSMHNHTDAGALKELFSISLIFYRTLSSPRKYTYKWNKDACCWL